MLELENVFHSTLESDPFDGYRWTRHLVDHRREGICGTHRLTHRAVRLIRKSKKSTVETR